MKATSRVRTRVIDTVSRLFYEQGFQATGINQIIEESGVAKASLYEHFPSKEDILHAYLEHAHAQWTADFEDFSAASPAGEKKLMALFDYRKKLALDRHFRGCAFVRVAYELPDLDEQSLDMIRKHKDYVKGILKQQVSLLPGGRPKKQQEELVEMIFSLYEGCSVQSALSRTSIPFDTARKITQKLIQ